jgi:hypothetical protein
MTGFDSKRQAAKAKLDDDDDTQVYSDTLTIVYQRGFADGKKAAQRKPLTDEEIQAIWDVAAGAIPGWSRHIAYARAIEAAHGIKEGT